MSSKERFSAPLKCKAGVRWRRRRRWRSKQAAEKKLLSTLSSKSHNNCHWFRLPTDERHRRRKRIWTGEKPLFGDSANLCRVATQIEEAAEPYFKFYSVLRLSPPTKPRKCSREERSSSSYFNMPLIRIISPHYSSVLVDDNFSASRADTREARKWKGFVSCRSVWQEGEWREEKCKLSALR